MIFFGLKELSEANILPLGLGKQDIFSQLSSLSSCALPILRIYYQAQQIKLPTAFEIYGYISLMQFITGRGNLKFNLIVCLILRLTSKEIIDLFFHSDKNFGQIVNMPIAISSFSLIPFLLGPGSLNANFLDLSNALILDQTGYIADINEEELSLGLDLDIMGNSTKAAFKNAVLISISNTMFVEREDL
jgi:hypothetical protein